MNGHPRQRHHPGISTTGTGALLSYDDHEVERATRYRKSRRSRKFVVIEDRTHEFLPHGTAQSMSERDVTKAAARYVLPRSLPKLCSHRAISPHRTTYYLQEKGWLKLIIYISPNMSAKDSPLILLLRRCKGHGNEDLAWGCAARGIEETMRFHTQGGGEGGGMWRHPLPHHHRQARPIFQTLGNHVHSKPGSTN